MKAQIMRKKEMKTKSLLKRKKRMKMKAKIS